MSDTIPEKVEATSAKQTTAPKADGANGKTTMTSKKKDADAPKRATLKPPPKGEQLHRKTMVKKAGPTCPNALDSSFLLKTADLLVDKDANPRKTFDRENLKAVAANIKQVGIINPLSVFWGSDGKYHLIAGERRLRAAKIAGMKVVPVRLFENDDVVIATIRLVENLQQEKLNPLEEALALKPLLGKRIVPRGKKKSVVITNKVLALEITGKSQAWVSQRFSLLDMPKQIQDALLSGKISFVHARDLIALPSQEAQVNLFEKLMKGESSKSDLKDEAAKAKTARARAKEGKTRGRTADDGAMPNITRQSLDTALERLQAITFDVRKKSDVREGIATAYERFDRAKTEETKLFQKGVVAGVEWAAGLREKL